MWFSEQIQKRWFRQYPACLSSHSDKYNKVLGISMSFHTLQKETHVDLTIFIIKFSVKRLTVSIQLEQWLG
jgi:hypothetical protein